MSDGSGTHYQLFHYNKPGDATPKGVINLAGCTVAVLDDGEAGKFIFNVTTAATGGAAAATESLSAPSSAERDRWVTSIQRASSA